MLHFSIAWPLPKLHAELIEALARLLNVVDGDRDVSEPTAGIGVSISVALEVGVRFGAVVVGELEDACFDFRFSVRGWFKVSVTFRHGRKGMNQPSRAKREASFSSLVSSLPSWLKARK